VIRILITGASGFCGRHLIDRLAARGYNDLHGADINDTPPKNAALKSYAAVDISNESQVKELLGTIQPDAIYHLAGRQSGAPLEIYRINFVGSLHLLEAVRCNRPRAKVLIVGSAAEYGHVPREAMPVSESFPCRPVSPYGISKYAATLMARDYANRYNIRVVTARPFNIIGAGLSQDLVIGAVIDRIKRAIEADNHPLSIPVGNLETERDFIAVDDIVDAYIAMMDAESWGDVFNLCSGVPRTVRSVIQALLSHSARPIQLQVDPALVRPSDVPSMFGSFDKAHKAFGFMPKHSLDEALKSAWEEAVETVA
jgi:GDP-4-dehydro-6-deoxy-D-mannose reductase